MPQVTVYVRKDDLPKWESIQKKSEFLHNALDSLNMNFGKHHSTEKMILKHRDYSKSDKFKDLQKDHDVRYEPPEDIA